MLGDHSNSISENGIQVHLIENTSGLFVGTVQANGWQSKSKTNQVFGHLHSSKAQGLIGILQDNDHLDMINVDRSLKLSRTQEFKADQDVEIRVGGVHVNAMQTNASISVGVAQVNHWDTKGKNNFGTGKLVGKNELKSIMNNIDDRDEVDMSSNGGAKNVVVQSKAE